MCHKLVTIWDGNMNSGELIEFFALNGYQIAHDAIDSLKSSPPEEVIEVRDLCDIYLPDVLVISDQVLTSLANFAPSQKIIITFSAEAT